MPRSAGDVLVPLMLAAVAVAVTLAAVLVGARLAVLPILGLIVLAAIYRPAATASFWIWATLAIPCWYGATLPAAGYVQPASLLALPVMVALWLGNQGRVRPFDVAFILIVLLGFVASQFGTPISAAKGTLLTLFVPYLLGRAVFPHRERVGRAIAIGSVVMAALAIVEIFTRYHPFVGTGGTSPLGFWADIQTRGSYDRSEVTLGHALALGGVLVLGLPFVLTHLKRRRLWGLVVIGGVVSTVSRGPILAAILCLLLVFAPRLGLPTVRRARGGVLVALVAVAVVLLPIAKGISTQESTGLNASAQYRTQILPLVGDLRPVGLARNAIFDPVTKSYLFEGRFGSIDNAWLSYALNSGYVPTLIFLVGLLVLLRRYLRGQADPAVIALLAQIPILLTVALITQWPLLLAFIAGIAASRETRTEAGHQRLPAQQQTMLPRPSAWQSPDGAPQPARRGPR